MASPGKGRILKNLGSLSVGKLTADLAAFGLFVVISRQLGEEGVGQYSFAMAITGFLMVFADFGLEFLSTRELSRLAHEKLATYVGRVIAVRIFQTSIAIGMLAILCLALPYPTDFIFVIFVIGLFQIFYKGLDGLAAVFIAKEEMLTAAALSASLRILAAIGAAVLIIAGVELAWSLIVFPLFTCLQIGVAYRMVSRRIGHIRPYASYLEIKATMRQALPFATSEFLRQLATRSDVVLLGILVSAGAAGIYNAAFRIIFMLSLFSYLAGLAIYPRVSRLFKTDPAQTRQLYSQYLGVVIIVSVPASVGLAMIAIELIHIIFGDAFTESGFILQVLAALVAATTMKFMMQMFMMAGELQGPMVRSQWIVTLANLALLLVLIPAFGSVGAGAAVVIAEVLLVVLYAGHLKSLVGLPRIGHRVLLSLFGSAVTVSLVSHLQLQSMITIMPLTIVVYTAIVLCSAKVRRTELKLLLEAIHR
jgi:O-antigen/teichoic acid export membrane protein